MTGETEVSRYPWPMPGTPHLLGDEVTVRLPGGGVVRGTLVATGAPGELPGTAHGWRVDVACMCGRPLTPGVVHRADGPCHHTGEAAAPRQPKRSPCCDDSITDGLCDYCAHPVGGLAEVVADLTARVTRLEGTQ